MSDKEKENDTGRARRLGYIIRLARMQPNPTFCAWVMSVGCEIRDRGQYHSTDGERIALEKRPNGPSRS